MNRNPSYAHTRTHSMPNRRLLNRCTTLRHLQSIHAQLITSGILSRDPSSPFTKLLYALTTLTSLPPPSLPYAVTLFRRIPHPSTFSHNLLIRAFTLLSSPLPALHLFAEMRRSGTPPDFHTFPFTLKACASLGLPFLPVGRALHSQVLRFAYLDDVFVRNSLVSMYVSSGSIGDARRVFDDGSWRDVVSYNALIDGYVKGGEMEMARSVFDEMPVRDVVSCGTLLAGYSKSERYEESFALFDWMVAVGLTPDDVALVSMLSCCAQLGDLDRGRGIHDYIERNGIKPNVYVLTGLVDMYAKCGCIGVARDIFDSSRDKNLFTWNAIIVGLASHGHAELSIEYFSRMQEAGVRADGVTFLGVLMGCTHAGHTDTARRLFNEMERVHRVRKELKHYGCMSDLLSRSGLIREAMEMIRDMPMPGDVYVWGGVLGGCRIHGNVKVAEIAVRHLLELNPEDSGIYSIMANIYATARRWEDAARIRRYLSNGSVKKNIGSSSLC